MNLKIVLRVVGETGIKSWAIEIKYFDGSSLGVQENDIEML